LVQKYEKNAVANDKCVFATCTEFRTPYTFFGHKAFTAISYPGDMTVQNHSLPDAFTFPLIFYHCKLSQQIKTSTIGTFDILFSTVFDTVLLYFYKYYS
jgi:hypothetical protein